MSEISVVICTYNRDGYILAALDSLKKQDASRDVFEIIVVNNNSTDKTEEKCKFFEQSNPELNFTYTIEANQGLSFARNKGIEVSKAPLIVFIDDDAIAEKDFVGNLLQNFEENSDYEAVGGKVLPIYPDGKEPKWMSKYVQRLVSKVDDGEKKREFRDKYPVGCNMAFRKTVFDEVGGFNTDLTLRSDDKYIFMKLKKAGKRTFYAPDVIVHHNIEAFRLTPKFIKNLSKLNGHCERVRLKTEPWYKSVFKFFDYVMKIGASFVISIPFIFKGEFAKASYLIKVMVLSMIGFFYFKD